MLLPVPFLRLPAPWVLHLTVQPWILPLRYLEYAGIAKTRFRPSLLALSFPSILSSSSAVLSVKVVLSTRM